MERAIGYTGMSMTDAQPARRYRFGTFEANVVTEELRRNGLRVKLNAQPFQMLVMLLKRPGELLTREEICRELWPDGTFVDYEHGVNSAVNRIREALRDTAVNPRFVETLARRGYRFVAPVERMDAREDAGQRTVEFPSAAAREQKEVSAETEAGSETGPVTKTGFRILATPEELPKASHHVVKTLFILLQIMYLSFYVGALANLAEIEELFSPLQRASEAFVVLIVTAAMLIPVRLFVLTAVLFHAPGLRGKFLRMWPVLLAFDELWALAPFLLLHHINFGLALACMTPLVYSPFAQRSLVLMGAGKKTAS
jgi:cholera toxin transcriptional activator